MNEPQPDEITDIETYRPPQPAEMRVTRKPADVLQEAQEAAKALMQLVAQKKKPVIMGGEQYLEYGDWQVLGKFYGVTVRIAKSQYIEFEDAKGFEATAEVVTHSGIVVSSADAMCLNSERNWQKKDLFQLRSMAQTRAGAKALRTALGWVAELAGYKSTPAEEMNGIEPKTTQSKLDHHSPAYAGLKSTLTNAADMDALQSAWGKVKEAKGLYQAEKNALMELKNRQKATLEGLEFDRLEYDKREKRLADDSKPLTADEIVHFARLAVSYDDVLAISNAYLKLPPGLFNPAEHAHINEHITAALEKHPAPPTTPNPPELVGIEDEQLFKEGQ